MYPVKCPVCEGRGQVAAGFYHDKAAEYGPQQCRACSGNGWMWAYPTTWTYQPYYPQQPYYPWWSGGTQWQGNAPLIGQNTCQQ